MNKKKATPVVLTHPVASVEQQIDKLQGWYSTVEGAYVLAELRQLVTTMTEEVFGYYALELGLMVEHCNLLCDSRISTHIKLSTNPYSTIADTITKAEALPIGFNEIDLVVGCHVLDYAHSPHHVLREIERVLVPEGHCVLISFNPWSLRGLGQTWNYLRRVPDRPAMYTKRRIRDWFEVLGFEMLETYTLGFRPALKSDRVFKHLEWVDRLGQKYQLPFGSVQVIHVRKQVSRLIPLKPKVRATKTRLRPEIAINTTSTQSTNYATPMKKRTQA
ncbi:methyltransferase domain-containing protein [uncultured Thiothrix sp.]|uniref:class I SAM-dependent methyltransferase n=1 Tax=uncultured Thiothrix sp. TaxID=223185 RepID=UPI00260A99CF|nr:methyltransferase domain-containing protein [uncultured Thiothrix sp.]